MTGLSALIARLEAATEGSRELDWAIAVNEGGEVWNPLYFTTSLDAALTLVPAHHMWEVRHGIGCRAVVWTLEQDYDGHSVPVGNTMDQPALALCIASLKARRSA